MVKNESDILESFIRHTLHYVDDMIIMDHTSSDGSMFILDKLKAEGLPIHVRIATRTDHAKARIITDMMYEAVRKFKAGLVVPLDADEFIYADAKDILRNLPTDRVYKIDLYNAMPSTLASPRRFLLDVPAYMAKKPHAVQRLAIGTQIIQQYHVGIKSAQLTVSEAVENQIPYEKLETVFLAHYPIRSTEQFIAKITSGWIALMARPLSRPTDAPSWQRVYDKLKRGETIERDDMLLFLGIGDIDSEMNLLPKLTSDKVPNQPIRYQEYTAVVPFQNFLYTAESIALDYSKNRDEGKPPWYFLKQFCRSTKFYLKYLWYAKIRGVFLLNE